MTRAAKERQDIKNWSEQLSTQAESGQLKPIEGSRTYRGENATAMKDDGLIAIFHGRQGEGMTTKELISINELGAAFATIGFSKGEPIINEGMLTLFNQSLAAHDAEVRDKALSLTDSELAIAEGAYESSIMEYESDGLGAMSIALKAIAEDRRKQ